MQFGGPLHPSDRGGREARPADAGMARRRDAASGASGMGRNASDMTVAKGFREVDHRCILAHGRHRSLRTSVTLSTRGSVGSRVRLQLGQGRLLGPPTRLSWTQQGASDDEIDHGSALFSDRMLRPRVDGRRGRSAEHRRRAGRRHGLLRHRPLRRRGPDAQSRSARRSGGSLHAGLQRGAVQPHAGVAVDGPLSAPGRNGLAR